jgi:hypothetical protein
VTSIGKEAFSRCPGLVSITIPNSVTSIGAQAFENCSGLTSVTIPNSVTIINENTFHGCSNLTSIIIPDGVKIIYGNAFSGCSSLTSITLPKSVISVGANALKNCSSLSSVTCYAENVPGTGPNAFSGVPQSMSTLHVPESAVDLYKAAAQWKDFGTIVGFDPTAVDELKASSAKDGENAPIYDLNGRRLIEKPKSGYYIQGGKKYYVEK